MRIGVIGTGNMGRHLGLLWAEQGHEVFFGSRNLEKAAAAAALSSHSVQSGTNEQAAEFGEVLLFTIRDVDPKSLVSDPSAFDGKVVIDCNNGDVPDSEDYPGIDVSLAEVLQQQIPNARVVKAFNTMPNEMLELCPDLIEPYEVSVYIAGDDPAARETVAQLAREIGMAPIDAGVLAAARRIETLARLLITQILKTGYFLTTLSIQRLPQPDRPPRLGGREMSPQTEADMRSLEASS